MGPRLGIAGRETSHFRPTLPGSARAAPGAPLRHSVVMKHAGPEALDHLADLLEELRGLPGLREKNRGTFYRGSRAFLHFHEDPTGLFADVRIDSDFERLRVSDAREQKQLLGRVRDAL